MIFYYTKAFRRTTPDIRGHVDGLILNANLAFKNSEIPLEIQLHCIVQAKIGEKPDSAERMREFKESKGKDSHSRQKFEFCVGHPNLKLQQVITASDEIELGFSALFDLPVSIKYLVFNIKLFF